jgi:hypothetical protein
VTAAGSAPESLSAYGASSAAMAMTIGIAWYAKQWVQCAI